MKITILTLFPDILTGFFNSSIMAKAVKANIISYQIIDWRLFTSDRHHKCDDSPFGGGSGMVIKPEPLFKALDYLDAIKKRVVYATPSGRPFNQHYAYELSAEEELIFICGHYEGIINNLERLGNKSQSLFLYSIDMLRFISFGREL